MLRKFFWYSAIFIRTRFWYFEKVKIWQNCTKRHSSRESGKTVAIKHKSSSKTYCKWFIIHPCLFLHEINTPIHIHYSSVRVFLYCQTIFVFWFRFVSSKLRVFKDQLEFPVSVLSFFLSVVVAWNQSSGQNGWRKTPITVGTRLNLCKKEGIILFINVSYSDNKWVISHGHFISSRLQKYSNLSVAFVVIMCVVT